MVRFCTDNFNNNDSYRKLVKSFSDKSSFDFKNKDNKALSLGMTGRILLLPFTFLWWLIQFVFLSLICGTFICIIEVFIVIGELTRTNPKWFDNVIGPLFTPFVCPVIWWIRYWKFGEYKALNEFGK